MPKGHIKDGLETQVTNENSAQKSVRDVSNVLEILDSQRIQTNPFGANISGDNSYRRAERISAALHLVTNHVPESEPVRVMVRESALRLLGRILELRSGFRGVESEKGQSALVEIRSIISQVRLLAIAGYISGQNARTIIETIDELGNLIVISQRSTLAEQVSLSREDLLPKSQSLYRTTIGRTIRDENKRRVTIKPIKDNNGNLLVSNTGSDRSARILDILRLGGELGIKDISTNLPQYSEKMIQRELADLVERKAVLKMGEKRWSRYRVMVA